MGTPEEEKNKDVVREFIRLFGSNDPADIPKRTTLWADDATYWVPGNLPLSGTQQGIEEIAEKHLSPNKSLTVSGSKSTEVGYVVAEGEYVCAEWILRRKVTNGNDYENRFCGMFQIRKEKIQSIREHLDTQYAKDTLWPDWTPPEKAV